MTSPAPTRRPDSDEVIVRITGSSIHAIVKRVADGHLGGLMAGFVPYRRQPPRVLPELSREAVLFRYRKRLFTVQAAVRELLRS